MLPHLTLLPLFLPILDLIPNLHRTAARGREQHAAEHGDIFTLQLQLITAEHPTPHQQPTPACNSFAQGQGRFCLMGNFWGT